MLQKWEGGRVKTLKMGEGGEGIRAVNVTITRPLLLCVNLCCEFFVSMLNPFSTDSYILSNMCSFQT